MPATILPPSQINRLYAWLPRGLQPQGPTLGGHEDTPKTSREWGGGVEEDDQEKCYLPFHHPESRKECHKPRWKDRPRSAPLNICPPGLRI